MEPERMRAWSSPSRVVKSTAPSSPPMSSIGASPSSKESRIGEPSVKVSATTVNRCSACSVSTPFPESRTRYWCPPTSSTWSKNRAVAYPEVELPPLTRPMVADSTLSQPSSVQRSRFMVNAVASFCPRLSNRTETSKGWFGTGISGIVVTAPCMKRRLGSTGLGSMVKVNRSSLSVRSTSFSCSSGSMLMTTSWVPGSVAHHQRL